MPSKETSSRFTGVREPLGNLRAGPGKSGFYFTISSKLSNLFNLFGTTNSMETTGRSDTGGKQK